MTLHRYQTWETPQNVPEPWASTGEPPHGRPSCCPAQEKSCKQEREEAATTVTELTRTLDQVSASFEVVQIETPYTQLAWPQFVGKPSPHLASACKREDPPCGRREYTPHHSEPGGQTPPCVTRSGGRQTDENKRSHELERQEGAGGVSRSRTQSDSTEGSFRRPRPPGRAPCSWPGSLLPGCGRA